MSAVVQERSPLEQPYEATTRSASAGTKEINQLQPNVRDTAKRLWRNLKSWMFVELDHRRDLLGSFDGVICLETIEHIMDDLSLMRSMAAFIKPGED